MARLDALEAKLAGKLDQLREQPDANRTPGLKAVADLAMAKLERRRTFRCRLRPR